MSKKAKKALVPKLRFPEFLDNPAWNKPRLNEVSDRIINKVGKASLTTVSISAGIGFVSQVEKFSRDISGKQYKNYIILNKGDFSYNKGNSKKFPQGCIYKLKEFKTVAAPNAFISFRFKEDYVANFYQGYFDNNFHGKQLMRFITSGARSDGLLNIRPGDFFSIQFPTPANRVEQQKIADCLSSIDDLITAHRQKHEALKAHKKGLMQQLFPAEGETIPKRRFPEFRDAGAWKEAKLGDKEISGFIKDKTPLDQLDIDSYISTENLLPDYAGVKTATKLPPSGSFTQFKKNDVLISNIRPYLKKVWQAQMVGSASNDVIIIRAKNKIIDNFLMYILKNDDFINYVMKGAKGVKMPRGDISSIKKYPSCYPSKQEQQKIANCLSSLDNLITAQSQKIESLKTHKKGLMQQLFPAADDDCMDAGDSATQGAKAEVTG